MKKTLLIAAIGVAGLVSTKGSTKTILSESKSAKKEVVKKTKNAQAVKALFYRWGKRISPCGIVYYLDLDKYQNTSELYDAIDDFDTAKCGYTD
ncbi:hypothetical protein CMT60_00040 [Elizabethkingia anophelis]|uniref:hypothetical protein n=1 Tax=Elizabethkingia anophelis TaxID=1117645 RepID=UPI000D03E709|nr:hypothetical protein [Elizabethkingia anophelis]PRQ82669.1 hypothetical protein CMT60_00040 [Elizabethkingia anophelis]